MPTDSQSDRLAEQGRVRLRRAAVVAVVQSADQRNGDDLAERWWRDRPGVWRVLRQREMRPRLVVVRQVPAQDAGQSRFIHDDHVIKTLASNGTDDPLRVRVLPRGTRSGTDLLDAHASRGGRDGGKSVVAIVHEVARGRVIGKGIAELLGGPRRGRRIKARSTRSSKPPTTSRLAIYLTILCK